jgi:hypothetical protein
MADDRSCSLEFLTTYPDHSIGSSAQDVEFHRQQIGELQDAGVTWLGIPGVSTSESHTLEVIESVAKNYG